MTSAKQTRVGPFRSGIRAALAVLGASACLTGPTEAFAADPGGGDPASLRLVLEGTISPRCGFIEVPASIVLELPAATSATSTLSYSCNLPQSTPVTVTMTSENGGLKRNGDGVLVPYTISWSAVRGDGAPAIRVGREPLVVSVQSGQVGSTQSGVLVMQVLAAPDDLVAGRYGDRVTYSISP